MLATPMKAMAASAMKFIDANIWVPMSNCTEKNIDKTPEATNRTTRYLRIEAKTSKI